MAELNRSVDWLHAEKAMSMAYSTMEDRKVALLRERIQMETQTGYNLFYYCGAVSQYIRYSVQILASVSMTVSLFRLDAVSAGAKLGLLGGTLLTVAVSILTAKQSGKLRNRFYASCVDSNILGDRLFDYMKGFDGVRFVRMPLGLPDKPAPWVLAAMVGGLIGAPLRPLGLALDEEPSDDQRSSTRDEAA